MAITFTTNSPAITAGSLGIGSARCSSAVTTTSANSITQIMLTVSVLTTTTAPTANKQVIVYGYYSEDGTTYTGGSTTEIVGTDAAITMGSPTNLKLIGVISKNTGATAATLKGVFELTSVFGCVPRKWGIVLLNDDGAAALGATVSVSSTEISYA